MNPNDDIKSILIAEDDPITRQSLKRFLGKDHEVFTAENGEEAWRLFAKHRPRLVVTDWRMPKMDGLELCAKIREITDDDYTFIIVLTSTSGTRH